VCHATDRTKALVKYKTLLLATGTELPSQLQAESKMKNQKNHACGQRVERRTERPANEEQKEDQWNGCVEGALRF
jgi:hypothetical protein